MSDQLTLFNLKEFESVASNPVYDPYWDELQKEPSAIFDQPLLCEYPRGAITQSAVLHPVQQIFSAHEVSIQIESVSESRPTATTEPYSLTTKIESLSEYTPTPAYSLTTQTESVSEYAPTPPTPPYSLTTQTESVSEYSHTPPYSLTDSQGINVYSPGGTATKGNHKYFRCSCKHGNRTRHIHIPGGNIQSILAQKNAEIIRQAFAGGRSYEEIRQIVRSLPSARCWGRT